MGSRSKPSPPGTWELRYRQSPIYLGATGRLVETAHSLPPRRDHRGPCRTTQPLSPVGSRLVLCQKGRFVADSGNLNENHTASTTEGGAATAATGSTPS